jgi:ribonuclease HII
VPIVVGLDEVGYGPLAGPVVVAGVHIEEGAVEGVRDSKLIEEQRRYELADLIKAKAPWTKIAARGADAINERKLGNCWIECVIEVAEAARRQFPESEVILDGVPPEKTQKKLHARVPFVRFMAQGDDHVYQISAASIVAKSYRDKIMILYAKDYPGYGFEIHKGYGTSKHIAAVKQMGMCPLHRIAAMTKAMNPKNPKAILDPSQEVAHYSPEEARQYVARAIAAGLRGDFETKFIPDMKTRLDIQGDLSPRQKYFLKRITHDAEHRARKAQRS